MFGFPFHETMAAQPPELNPEAEAREHVHFHEHDLFGTGRPPVRHAHSHRHADESHTYGGDIHAHSTRLDCE